MSDERSPETPPVDEPFISRWSRRKLSEEEESLPTEEQLAEAVPETPSPTDADMPPLESLNEQSDYSGFLSPKVSEALRQQALQKLFSSAGFNLCDGLDDYAEDFTRFEKLGDLITSDLRFRLQQEAKRAAERAEALADEEIRQQEPTSAERETETHTARQTAQTPDPMQAPGETPEQST